MAKDIFTEKELYDISRAEYHVQNPSEEYGYPEDWYDFDIWDDIKERLGEELTEQDQKKIKNILTDEEKNEFKEKMKDFVSQYYRNDICDRDEIQDTINMIFDDFLKDD